MIFFAMIEGARGRLFCFIFQRHFSEVGGCVLRTLLSFPILRERWKKIVMVELEEPKSESEKITVLAYDYASSYDLRSARDFLQKDLKGKTLQADPLLVQLEKNRMVAVFEYGSIVFFNLEEAGCKEIIEKLKPFAQRPNKFISEDNFVLYPGPRLKKPEGTEELVIRELNRDIAMLVGVVLSRSVSLEYYERLVSDALAQYEEIITELAVRGWIPRKRRDQVKRVGLALSVEHELVYNVSVFDDPDIVWDGGSRIEQLYLSMRKEFDLEDRIKVLQQKISLISRSSTFFLSRLEAQRSNMLELIIIILILSEIILVLFGKM